MGHIKKQLILYLHTFYFSEHDRYDFVKIQVGMQTKWNNTALCTYHWYGLQESTSYCLNTQASNIIQYYLYTSKYS